jgi:hypothetical protein
MPLLNWETKSNVTPQEAKLEIDSVVYPGRYGYPDRTPVDHLVWGDNLGVMHALLPEYEGRVRLIYADPPFYTNRRYPARIGRGEDSRRPKDWRMAEGYPDHWPDLESYLDMLYPRLQMMHRLLTPDGTLYLHLDWHANSYARVLLDEIFGQERLLNEIIWVYHGPSPIRSAFNRKHDTILVYTKSDEYVFNVDDVRQPYDPSTVKTFASSSKAGFGKVPDLKRGKVPEDWWYFCTRNGLVILLKNPKPFWSASSWYPLTLVTWLRIFFVVLERLPLSHPVWGGIILQVMWLGGQCIQLARVL